MALARRFSTYERADLQASLRDRGSRLNECKSCKVMLPLAALSRYLRNLVSSSEAEAASRFKEDSGYCCCY